MTKPSRRPESRTLRLPDTLQSGSALECQRTLKQLGIRTVGQLLATTSTIRDRLILSSRSGLSAAQVREIVSLAEFQLLTGYNAYLVRRVRNVGVKSLSDLADSDPYDIVHALLDEAPLWDVPVRDLVTLLAIWISEARSRRSVLH